MSDFGYLVSVFSAVGVVGGAIALSPRSTMATPAAPLVAQQSLAQGHQITINGRAVAAAWQQWQTPSQFSVAVDETALLNHWGVQLLNTESPALQPVQWFTPANQTLNLAARSTSTLRYLDITALARQFRWQFTIAGSTLQISTPPARVVGIRQSQQPWGDRVVIELDQPIPWQTTAAQDLQISLEAQINPDLIRQFKSVPGRFLAAVNLEPVANQTRFRFSLSSKAATRVWSLSAPNRIVVDIRPDALVEQNIVWAPGLRWRQQIVDVNNMRIPTVWLEVAANRPNIVLQPILPNPNSMTGTAPLLQTANQAQVAGAINGGFFNRDRQLPLGAIRLNGNWLSGPILNRGAVAWDNAGNVAFERLSLQETLITSTGQRLPITHLNSGYIQAGIARYTPGWGTAYTTLTDGEIIVFVQSNRIIGQQPVEKAGTASLQIPIDGYILVLRSNRSAAATLTPGLTLQLESRSNPPDFQRYPQILGAGPLLIQNQQIVLDARAEGFSNAFAVQSAPRSAIAQRLDGTLLFVTAHNRLDGTSLTLLDMAQLLRQMGAVHALNLDGGSSTTLYLGGRLLDRTPRTAARVHNGLGILVVGTP
jgi:hypothetical protein